MGRAKINTFKRALREFTDRLEPRQAFWNRYLNMRDGEFSIITYYGAGGVGKTAILRKLREEIKHKSQMMQENIAFIHYDFNNDCDTRSILQNLKAQLSDYGCEFPLYEVGSFYHTLKVGKSDIDPPKAKSLMNTFPYLRKLKPHLDNIGSALDGLEPGMYLRALPSIIKFLDKHIAEYLESKKFTDEQHKWLREEIAKRRESQDHNELLEFLPNLFAQDVTDWLMIEAKATGKRKSLIVFLDTYEALINEATFTKVQRKRDLWLRDDEVGIINFIPNTLWVISGRNKLRWTGELAKELEHHLITALSDDDSDYFLKTSGIESAELRKDIIKLTQGLPIYLDLCIDIYERYKRNYDTEPNISAFGEHRQEVIDRLIKYMDASIQDMISFLCVLNTWTDEIAKEIGAKALPNFSIATYNQIKYFSFIKDDEFQLDDFSVTTYNFDKTIHNILFPNCDEFIIKKTIAAVDEYFNNLVDNIEIYDTKFTYYMKYWAVFIVRTTENPEELQQKYRDNIKSRIGKIYSSEATFILNLFVDKIKTFSESIEIYSAYFDYELGMIESVAGNYQKAYEYMYPAYEKYSTLLGDKNEETIAKAIKLIEMLIRLTHYKEALKLAKHNFEISKEAFGEDDVKTITLKVQLGGLMMSTGNLEEGIELIPSDFKEIVNKIRIDKSPQDLEGIIVKTREKLEKLLEESGSLSISELLTITNKKMADMIATLIGVFDVYSQNNESNNLDSIVDLKKVNEKLESAIKRKDIQYVEIIENLLFLLIEFNKMPSNDFCSMKHYEKILYIYKIIYDIYKENFSERNIKTINAMRMAATLLTKLGHYDEAAELLNKVLNLRKDTGIYVDFFTIYDMLALSDSLIKLGNYEETAKYQEQMVNLSHEICGMTYSDKISIINDISSKWISLKEYHRALHFSDMSINIILNDSSYNEKIAFNALFRALQNHSEILFYLERYEESLKYQEQLLNLCDKEPEHKNRLMEIMYDLAVILYHLKRNDEALQMIERSLPLAKEFLTEEEFAEYKERCQDILKAQEQNFD